MQRLLQFTLDLFETTHEPAAPAKAPGRAPRAANPRPAAPPQAMPDAVPEATAPATDALSLQTLQQALAPATFRHPRASRETLLGGILVAYEFRRGKRRTIGFS